MREPARYPAPPTPPATGVDRRRERLRREPPGFTTSAEDEFFGLELLNDDCQRTRLDASGE